MRVSSAMTRTKLIAIPLLLLCACGTGGVTERADNAVQAAVQTANLTGLYEGGAERRPSQMCIVDRGSGNSRFGLVVHGAGEASCSGAGSAVRTGEVLRLTMTGDEQCTIEARIAGAQVTFPASVPEGCAYYCGAGASLAGAELVKTGGEADDAMRARDLVGDPLCG